MNNETDYLSDSRKIRKKYSHFLKGKKVVIICNSPHVVGTNEGKKIEQYDVVVRLNGGYIIVTDKYRKDVGRRTDILYSGLHSSTDLYSQDSLEYLIKKANKLGINKRYVVDVSQEEDKEGFHIYFKVTSMMEDK